MAKLVFITPVNNREVFQNNLLKSPIVSGGQYPLIIQEGYKNVCRAYNDGIKKVNSDFIVCVHQDVYLPPNWENDLFRALSILENVNWGVLGIAGVRLINNEIILKGHVLDRGIELGSSENLPATVDTLDELLLVLRRKNHIKFDEKIPSAHYYGGDICLTAKQKGLLCFAIDAYCHHNSSLVGSNVPPEFFLAREYMRKKWKRRLPFATTGGLVTPIKRDPWLPTVSSKLLPFIPKPMRTILRPLYRFLEITWRGQK
jgi:hypothetical protein